MSKFVLARNAYGRIAILRGADAELFVDVTLLFVHLYKDAPSNQ